MKKKSKRFRKRAELVDVDKTYSLSEAVDVIKKFETGKFDESIELNFQLGVDPAKAEESVRGTVQLPHGTGKAVKVAVFCKGDSVKAAEEAGAEYVGAEDLVTKIQGGWFDFDVVVAHPEMMKEVSKLGRVLGPKGMMPSPKAGTVATDIGRAVQEIKKGKIEIKSDKTGGLHVSCAKLTFSETAIVENAQTVIKSVLDHRPSSSKGEYLKGITLCVTQGPGLRLETVV